MTHLAAMARLDLRLQWRNGIFYAAAFVTAAWVALLRALPAGAVDTALPLVVYLDSAVIGLFFLAAAVLFEKDERTTAALVVTPLGSGEYIASKVGTMTVLAVAVASLIALTAPGVGANVAVLAVGVALLSACVLLAAFITVVRMDSITDYIIGVQLPLAPAILPLLPAFGVAEHPLFWLAPTQGGWVLIDGAANGIGLGTAVLAMAAQAAWAAVLVPFAVRAHNRHLAQAP